MSKHSPISPLIMSNEQIQSSVRPEFTIYPQTEIQWFNGFACVYLNNHRLVLTRTDLTGKITAKGMAYRLLDQMIDIVAYETRIRVEVGISGSLSNIVMKG